VLLRVIHNITNTIKTQPKYLSKLQSTMASKTNKIDTEWANSLVGLHVKVPDSWWVSFKTSNLNDGTIVSFDSVNEKWNLLLDDKDDDDQYLMAYDALCEYSNKEHSTFNQYQLPYHPVLVGDNAMESEDGTLYSLTPTEEWT
jgi:hypothetical protein